MTTVTFKTKLDKDQPKESAVETAAELDWNNVTDEQLRELATAKIVIMQQAIYRAAESVPTTDTIIVADLLKRERGGGFKVTPESMAKRVTKMSDDDYAATLRQMGLDEKVIAGMLKKRAVESK